MFVGQNKIMGELKIILPELRDNNKNINILLRAPSGYGKTTLGFIIGNNIDRLKSTYYIPDDDGNVFIRENYRIQFIDEVHLLKNPEKLYPLMDSGKYTFILATNETGELKEPLQNRCINYNFVPYSDNEIKLLIDNVLSHKPAGFDYYKYFIDFSRCPRVIVKLCQRIDLILTRYSLPKNEQEFKDLFENVLNIKNGLSEEQIRYIKFLLQVQSSSLDLISTSIGIDKATIKRDIEPALIYKNLLRITSKGRNIINV